MQLLKSKVVPSIRRRAVWLVGLVPCTVSGVLLVVVSLLVGFGFAKRSSDYLLYSAALLAIGLQVVCVLMVAIVALALWRQVRRLQSGIPDQVETETSVDTPFRVSRFAGWPLVEVILKWEEPESVRVELIEAGPWWTERIRADRRGQFAEVVRCFSVTDLFGLAKISFRRSWNAPLRIVPSMAAVSIALPTSQAQGDLFSHPIGQPEGDLVEMRAYGPGDPLRHVLWKTFARTQRLLVRMPERALSYPSINVAALVAGEGDEAACSVARLYLERNLFGAAFRFCADGATRPATVVAEAMEQLVQSVKVRHQDESARALDVLAHAGAVTSCVIFAPPVDGPWRKRVESFAAQLRAPAMVIIGVGESRSAALSPARRLFYRAQSGATHIDWTQLEELMARLRQCGLQVHLVHRQLGELL